MNHFIEIHTLTIRPNSRDEFHRLYLEEALPYLQRWTFHVGAPDPSRPDENTYYVIRRYDNLVQRDKTVDAYYASDNRRQGPYGGSLHGLTVLWISSRSWLSSRGRIGVERVQSK